MVVHHVTYYSDGSRVAADLYLPDDARGRVPAVVALPGLTAVKEQAIPDLAPALNQAGIAVLGIDYRGFGQSEGERNRLVPWERVHDARAAFDFLESLSEIDAQSLGIYGISYGGAVALGAAATDERVRWTLCLGSPANGETWLRSLRPYYQWSDLRRRLREDAVRRAVAGKSETIEAWDVMPPDPDSHAYMQAAYAGNPNWRSTLTMASAAAIIEYRPGELASRISPRALQIIHSRHDDLVPVEEALTVFATAGEPKELVLLVGASHFHTTRPGPFWSQVLEASLRSAKRHLLRDS